jgi:ABC-type branched-subunit amino acid transport system substrate-binding protein
MSARSIALGAAVIVATGAALLPHVSCKSYGSGGGNGGVNPAGPPLVIGASIALTGSLNGQIRALEGGLMTAQLQLNALGGILNRQVEFKIQDDGSQPTLAAGVVKGLLGSHSVGILGPAGSSQVQAVYPLVSAAKVVEVSATATSILLTEGYPAMQGWFFRTVPDDEEQGKAVVQFALRGPNGADAATGKCTNMAIVYNEDAYGMPMDQIIEPYFKSHGGTIVRSISVPSNVADSYMTQAMQITSSLPLPDCMAMVVFSPVGDQLVKDLQTAIAADIVAHPLHKKHWASFFIIGTDGCYDPTFITNGRDDPADPTSTSFVQGVYGTTADTNPPARVQYNDLKTLYEAEVGLESGMTDLDPYTSSEYDAAILLALAIQAAGSTDGAAVQQAMFDVSRGKSPGATAYGPLQVSDAIDAIKSGEDINYNGAAGDEDFDDYGNVIGDFIIWQVQGTGFVTHAYIPAAQL